MNKKLLFGFATTAVLGAAFVATTPVQAASDESMTTDAGIGFFDYNPGTGPFENNLALTFVPTSFNFGNSNDVNTNTKTFQQQNTPAAGQYLGVSDDRNTKTNWNVTASLSELTATDGSKLANAVLGFTTGTVGKYEFDPAAADAAGVAIPAPLDAAGATATGGTATISTLTSAGDYTAAGTAVTLTAGSTAGSDVLKYTLPTTAPTGTAAVAERIENVTLKVVGSSAKANTSYTGTVTWVLAQDPA